MADADIEDVLGRETYIELVNQCYNLTGEHAVPRVKPEGAQVRVVKEVGEHFQTLPTNVSEFDHFRPAELLMVNAEILRTTLPLETAVKNFEQLFTAVKKLLA